MVRRFVAACAAILLAIAFAPTDSSARGGRGFSGGHFHGGAGFRGAGFRGAGFRGAGFRGAAFHGYSGFRVSHARFRVAPVRFAYRTRYAGYYGYYGGYDSCLVPRRVFTPWGVTTRWINVCYGPYYGYY